MKKHLVTAILMAGIAPVVAGINETIEALGSDAAKGYLNPVVSALGSNLNQGWWRESPRPVLWGIDIRANPVFVGTQFDDGSKRFSTTTEAPIDNLTARALAKQLATTGSEAEIQAIATALEGKSLSMSIAGPTIVGPEDENVSYTMNGDLESNGSVYSTEGMVVQLPVTGLIPDAFLGVPTMFPQLTLGTLAGTQLAIRYAPLFDEFSFFGIGVNHNPGFWFEKAQLPFGINSSVNFAYTSFSYGDYLEFSGWNTGVMASRRFGWRLLNVTPYVGVGVEGSSLSVSYQTEYAVMGKPVSVSFEDEGQNFFRTTLGTTVRLGILDLSGDITMAKYNAASLVIGLGY